MSPQVKDSRGLRTLLHDTVRGDSTIQKQLGQAEVCLDSLPASGSQRWFSLHKTEGRAGRRERGEVRLALHLFRREAGLEEHTRLLRVLLSREVGDIRHHHHHPPVLDLTSALL